MNKGLYQGLLKGVDNGMFNGLDRGLSNGLFLDRIKYHPRYLAVLHKAISDGVELPGEWQQRRDNIAMIQLVSTGLFRRFDLFYGMSGNKEFARYNWVDPTRFRLTLFNNPSYHPVNGFRGNGSSIHIDTNWIAATDGVNYLQNDASAGIGVTTDINETASDFGVRHPNNNRGILLNTRILDVLNARVNTSANVAVNIANTNSIGRYLIKRHDSATVHIYKNGVSIGSGAQTSGVPPTASLVLLARREPTTAIIGWSSKSVNFFYCGSGLQGFEKTLDDILLNYKS